MTPQTPGLGLRCWLCRCRLVTNNPKGYRHPAPVLTHSLHGENPCTKCTTMPNGGPPKFCELKPISRPALCAQRGYLSAITATANTGSPGECSSISLGVSSAPPRSPAQQEFFPW